MKTESTDMQERAQQIWRELDGLDWSSHELAIVGTLRDALESAYKEGSENYKSADKYMILLALTTLIQELDTIDKQQSGTVRCIEVIRRLEQLVKM